MRYHTLSLRNSLCAPSCAQSDFVLDGKPKIEGGPDEPMELKDRVVKGVVVMEGRKLGMTRGQVWQGRVQGGAGQRVGLGRVG